VVKTYFILLKNLFLFVEKNFFLKWKIIAKCDNKLVDKADELENSRNSLLNQSTLINWVNYDGSLYLLTGVPSTTNQNINSKTIMFC
jgi:hypothetical protein